MTLETFTPNILEQAPLRVSIADNLREAIIRGDLEPDQRLDEQAIADKFGVSRIPIREAFALLKRDGLVGNKPRHGTYVIGVTEKDIHDIYEYRRLVEGHGIRNGAASVDAEKVEQLRGLVERIEAAIFAEQSEIMTFHDLAFHRSLVALGGNSRSLQFWDMLADLNAVIIRVSRSIHWELPKPPEPIDPYIHSKVLQMMEAHDVDGAEAQLRKHLEQSEWVSQESIKLIRAKRRATK
jgi:GntR family transcriptional regulator of gluconate operon